MRSLNMKEIEIYEIAGHRHVAFNFKCRGCGKKIEGRIAIPAANEGDSRAKRAEQDLETLKCSCGESYDVVIDTTDQFSADLDIKGIDDDVVVNWSLVK
jgi:hypothetical protein